MTLITTLRPVDVARGSLAKATADLANATGASFLSRVAGNAALAIGTTKSKVTLGATTAYTVNGNFYSKTGAADVWTLSGTTVAASSWQKYVLLLDASGTATIQEATQSTISAAAVSYANISGLSPWAPLLSLLNAGTTPIGVLTVATDATHTFIPGTTLLDAAGITYSVINGIDPYLLLLLANQAGTVVGLGA
jgi:hypothetical protein